MKRLFLCLSLCLTGCQFDRFEGGEAGDRFARDVVETAAPETVIEETDFKERATLSHRHLDVVLKRYAGEEGIDYASLWTDPEARALLADYRAIIAGVRPESMVDPNQRLSFWLNAYVALLVEGIAELVATQGVDAEVSFDDFAIYTRNTHRIAGFDLRLEEVEHLVLRGDPTYPDVRSTPSSLGQQLVDQHRLLFPGGRMDARVNFAVSFGARGFPRMPRRAYRAETLQQRLQERADEFVNDPVRGASERGISILFDWFRRDFVRDAGSVERFLARHYSGDVRQIDTERFLQFSWAVQ